MLKFLDRVITGLAYKILAVGDFITHAWQWRFRFGFTIDGPSIGAVTYPTGEKCFYVSLFNLNSHGTRHWPFRLFEAKLVTGRYIIGHICILGLTVGRSMKRDVDKETGEVLGPDRGNWYWVFSCINHQSKSFKEVV